MIKCPVCGEENKDGSEQCVNCMEPLMTCDETVPKMQEDAPALLLREVRSGREIEIHQSGIISRENSSFAPDFFSEDPHLSRPHCEISLKDGQWTVEDLHSLNNTYRNRNRVMPGFSETLHDGDRLTLADLVFKVSISSAVPSTKKEVESTNSPTDSEDIAWAIRCPVCGTYFQVECKDDRIESCPVCCDEMDREQIRFEHSQRVRREKCRSIESFIQ